MNIVFIPQTRHSSVDLNLADFFFFCCNPIIMVLRIFSMQSLHYAGSELKIITRWREQRGISVTTLCLCSIIFPRQCGEINHFVLRNYSKLVIMIR